MTDAYSYIRFSSYAQTLGDSLRRQMKAAYDYAAENGLTLRDDFTFKDLGVSAYDRSNIERGALSLFLKAVKDGRVKRGSLLLVENLDRLTRTSTYEAVALLGGLVKAGITVVTLSDKMAYTASSLEDDRALFYSVMLFARGHDESKRKSDLISTVYQGRRALQSKIICNIAPGWLVKDSAEKKWILDQPKAESVKKVYQMYLDGASAHSICQAANINNWPVPSMRENSSNWHVSMVRRILKNAAVTGKYIERTGVEHIEFFPQIVSDGDYARAQVAADTKSQFPRRRDTARYNVFQGLIFCGYCGATMGYRDHGKKEEHHVGETRRYFCTAHVRGATSTCKCRPGAKETQSNLIKGIFSLIADNVSVDENMVRLNKDYESAVDVLHNVRQRHQRILQMIEYSNEPLKTLAPRLSAVEGELECALHNLTDMRNRLEAVTGLALGSDSLEEAITNALDALEESAEARESLRITLQRYLHGIFLYGREGLAVVFIRDDPVPYHLAASDSGHLIRKLADGTFRGVRLKLPSSAKVPVATTVVPAILHEPLEGIKLNVEECGRQ